MTWSNLTGLPFVDIFVGGYAKDVFGDASLAIFALFFLLILVFVVAKAPRETILMAPAPALIAFGEYTGQRWIIVITWMIAGIYLAGFFIALFNKVDK